MGHSPLRGEPAPEPHLNPAWASPFWPALGSFCAFTLSSISPAQVSLLLLLGHLFLLCPCLSILPSLASLLAWWLLPFLKCFYRRTRKSSHRLFFMAWQVSAVCHRAIVHISVSFCIRLWCLATVRVKSWVKIMVIVLIQSNNLSCMYTYTVFASAEACELPINKRK